MTGVPWDTDRLELVARRFAFVDALTDDTARPHELVESLDVSRSTVSRALRELTDAGLVQRTNEGYVATVVGRIAATQYRAFASGTTAALDFVDALAPLPTEAPLDAAALIGASMTRPGDDRQPAEQLTDLLDGAEHVRLLTRVAPPAPVVRECRRLADADTTVELAGPPAVRDAFDPDDGDSEPLQHRDVGDDASIPPFTLFLVDDGDGTETVAVVIYERRAVHAMLVNDTDDAVAWGEELYADTTAGEDTTTVSSEPALPAELRSEGFVRLREVLAHREPSSPATAWRTGFGLPEVCAGYAVERTYEVDGERRELTGELVEGLREGTAHALVGPPGAGKSTACKLVARRWHEEDIGEVYYRESGRGGPFESAGQLADVARDSPGHTLIIVEDSIRPETNAVFELLDACRDDPDVSVLVDTREREWYESGELPADARLRSYRTDIETVRMPDVDERECERLVAGFEEVTERSVPAEPTELLAGIREADTNADGENTPAPGELFLLFHRLAAAAEPDAVEESTAPTSLDEDVVQTYRVVADAGTDTLTVAALVNLLNAAGIGIHPEYVHALAVVPEGADRVAVDDALEALDGRVLFGGGRGQYRSVHGMWSTAFLRHLLEAEGERAARRHLTTGINAVLALADEERHRRSVSRIVSGEASRLTDVTDDPGEWATTFLRRVFQLGQDHPGLAPLFGGTDGLAVVVPDEAPPSLAVDCRLWHGRMYMLGGEFEAAERAFDQAETMLEAADLDDEQARALQANCQLERSELARKRGDFDAADEYASAALEGYRALDDDRGRASALVKLGGAARGYGDYETARRYIEEGLDLHRELGATREIAADLHDLAIVAWLRGDFDDAEEYARRALDRARELGDERGRAMGLMTLGLVARSQGHLADAEAYTRQALDGYRELRDRQGEADALGDLSAVLREQGEFAAAETTAKEALTACRDIGDRPGEARCLARLGAVAHRRGDLEKASEQLEQALEVIRETGDQHGEAEVLTHLAAVDRERGAYTCAIDRLERAVRLHRNAGARRDTLDAIEQLVDVLAEAGQRSDARDWCDEGAGLADDYGIDERATALEERCKRLANEAS